MKSIHDLIENLTLKQLEDNTYQGTSVSIGSPNVFGGQVLAQALNASYRTILNNRILHSLHAYFLEAGDLTLPIVYNVEIIRNGGSFSTRRVTANQGEKTIFILAASFHKKEEGYEHQMPMKKDLKQPEELLSWDDMVDKFGGVLPKPVKSFLEIERPVDFKPVFVENPLDRKDLPPIVDVWFKLKGEAGALSLAMKQQVLTYVSDYNILRACLNPNASKADFSNVQMASLDHSMWFYRDFDFDDWMLYSIESPNTYRGRGFACGNIYTRDGKLIASVAQEGLMRPIKKK